MDKCDYLKLKTAYFKGYYKSSKEKKKSSKEISHRPGEDIYIICIKGFSGIIW